MLLVRIRGYLKSVLGYKYTILNTCHPGTLYLRERECEDPWLFFEAKRGLRAKKKSLGNAAVNCIYPGFGLA
jgi:hypothetical protein